jgi:hypothetical protein
MTNDRTTKWRAFERIGHWYFGFGICLVLGAWCLVIPAGCSSGGKTQPRVPVSGIVTLDGKPLSKAVVSLVPMGETAGDGGIATTDASGQFEVTSRDTKSRGCPIGSYTVMISKWANPDGSDFTPTRDVAPMDSGAKDIVPAAYNDPSKNLLTAEVPDGGTKTLEFKLNSKQK